MLGEPDDCSSCPYAIRGVGHLPAISAQKDKYLELMMSTLDIIEEHLGRKAHDRSHSELNRLEQENDRFAKRACMLEAIEAQLIRMVDTDEGSLMVKNRLEVIEHYSRVNVGKQGSLLKRLIDVQNFPDTSSELLAVKLSNLRCVLLMRDANRRNLFGLESRRPMSLAGQVATQISSMVRSGAISAYDAYAASMGEHEALILLAKPMDATSGLSLMIT